MDKYFTVHCGFQYPQLNLLRVFVSYQILRVSMYTYTFYGIDKINTVVPSVAFLWLKIKILLSLTLRNQITL